MRRRQAILKRLRSAALVTWLLATTTAMFAGSAGAVEDSCRSNLARVKVYLAAADYRRALEASQKQVDEAPSAESYVFLTYVYQAIEGYLEYLARTERWATVEQLYFNLASSNPQDLVDPPGGLARMAKETIQTSVRQQSDMAGAMAVRLDRTTVERLWMQQTAWREAHPDHWWADVPDEWDQK